MWWADDAVRERLADADNVPALALELYAHVLGAELVWLDRIESTPQTVPVWPPAGPEGLTALAATARVRYEAFFENLSPDRLPALIHYANSAGQEFDTRLDDILAHVALHGSYHRGQIALTLRQADLTPAPTDYIGWVRGTPAATRDSG